MKKTITTITFFLLLFRAISFAQEPCGATLLEKRLLERNPELISKKQKFENDVYEWKKLNGKKIVSPVTKSTKNTNSLMSFCGNDNSYFTTIAAPTVINQVSSPNPNCVYGGEYVTVTNLIAGNIYEISTCATSNFDTELSIYGTGNNFLQGFNDDLCGSQSAIFFNPIASGNYDILIDEYDCLSNSLCSSLDITLVYTPRPVITIPVVFHVVYKTQTENISDQQIQSAIDALNLDYRRLNVDILSVPACFRGESDDPLFEFCLAEQDPNGLPTTGITRTFTSVQKFNPAADSSIWFNALGGHDIWNRSEYLNVWVCDLPGDVSPLVPGMVGIGFFPWLGNALPYADGVVVDFQGIGTTGSATYPLDLNRNVTHEVGHWLGLHHIWGDDSGDCTGTDSIFDTPDQTGNSSGLPTFPQTDLCSPNFPGTMFHNYMDYSDDFVKSMFTYGQTIEMDAGVFVGRPDIINSIGCQPSTVGVKETINPNQIVIYPNPGSGNFQLIYPSNTPPIEIIIRDMMGKIILIKTGNINSLDLTNFSKGIYLAEIKFSKQSIIKKIVLN